MNTITNKPGSKESLFIIGEHFFALESLIIENEGVVDETIDQWLAEYQAKLEDKIDAYCYIITRYQEIAAEAKRLAERASRYAKTVSDLKDRLKYYMEQHGHEKVETTRFTVKVTSNGGLLPVVLSPGLEVDDLPEQFIKVTKEADMNKLRQALLSGDDEVYPFAMLTPRGTHLRIK
jgi:predicted nuclease with TOPRIM domain